MLLFTIVDPPLLCTNPKVLITPVATCTGSTQFFFHPVFAATFDYQAVNGVTQSLFPSSGCIMWGIKRHTQNIPKYGFKLWFFAMHSP